MNDENNLILDPEIIPSDIPCIVDGKEALFCYWTKDLLGTVGVVKFENGTNCSVLPQKIDFLIEDKEINGEALMQLANVLAEIIEDINEMLKVIFTKFSEFVSNFNYGEDVDTKNIKRNSRFEKSTGRKNEWWNR